MFTNRQGISLFCYVAQNAIYYKKGSIKMANVPSWPILRQGYSSEVNITALQALLNYRNNAGLSLTGLYDTATSNAVIAYQNSQSLEADGIAGPDTLSRLVSNCVIQYGSTNIAAYVAQLLLSKFEAITPTGYFDLASDNVYQSISAENGDNC